MNHNLSISFDPVKTITVSGFQNQSSKVCLEKSNELYQNLRAAKKKKRWIANFLGTLDLDFETKIELWIMGPWIVGQSREIRTNLLASGDRICPNVQPAWRLRPDQAGRRRRRRYATGGTLPVSNPVGVQGRRPKEEPIVTWWAITQIIKFKTTPSKMNAVNVNTCEL